MYQSNYCEEICIGPVVRLKAVDVSSEADGDTRGKCKQCGCRLKTRKRRKTGYCYQCLHSTRVAFGKKELVNELTPPGHEERILLYQKRVEDNQPLFPSRDSKLRSCNG